MLLADPGIPSHHADLHLVETVSLMLERIATPQASKPSSASATVLSAVVTDKSTQMKLVTMDIPSNSQPESMMVTAIQDQMLVV